MSSKSFVGLAAACFMAVASCKALAEFLEERQEQEEKSAPREETEEGKAADVVTMTASWEGRESWPADKPLAVKADTLASLGFKKVADAGLYALEAGARVPGWAASAAKPEASRDDDLLTAWTCKPAEGGMPCALSLVFPEDSRVLLVRIFAASGAGRKSYQDHARAKLLRIRMDGGWVDAKLKDSWDYQVVLLRSGVSTRGLTVEVKDVFAGKADSDIYIPEIEVFGTKGKRRAPLDIDVRNAVTRFDGAAWSSTGGEAIGAAEDIRATPSWIEFVDGNGAARRLFRGTGIIGRHGDCYLLVEKITAASCPGAYLGFKGSYTLVDTETRLYYDAGALGGLGSMVYRRQDGEGFATMSVDPEGEVGIGAVIIENGRFRLKREGKPSLPYAEDVLRVWGFKSEGKVCCDFGDPEEQKRVCTPIKAKDAIQAIGSLAGQDWREIVQFSKENPQAGWNECRAGEGLRVIVSSIHECDEVPNVAAVIDKSGKVRSSLIGSTMRIAVLPGGGLLIEVEKRGSTGSNIYTIDSGGEIRKTYPDAAFIISLPPACRCSA